MLFDAPPVRREVEFHVEVFFPKEDVYRTLAEVSPAVHTLARQQFDDYVKRVRIFVHPGLIAELRDAKPLELLAETFSGYGVIQMRNLCCLLLLAQLPLCWSIRFAPAEGDAELRRQATAALIVRRDILPDQVARTAAMSITTRPICRSGWARGSPARIEIWVQPPGTPTVGLAFLPLTRPPATSSTSTRPAKRRRP